MLHIWGDHWRSDPPRAEGYYAAAVGAYAATAPSRAGRVKPPCNGWLTKIKASTDICNLWAPPDQCKKKFPVKAAQRRGVGGKLKHS